MLSGLKHEQGEQHAKQDLGLEVLKMYHQTEPIEAMISMM